MSRLKKELYGRGIKLLPIIICIGLWSLRFVIGHTPNNVLHASGYGDAGSPYGIFEWLPFIMQVVL